MATTLRNTSQICNSLQRGPLRKQRPSNIRWSDKLSFSGAAAPFPRGRCIAQRIIIEMISGGDHTSTTVPEGRKGNADENVMVLERNRLSPMFDLTASLKGFLNLKVSSRIPLPTRCSFAALRAGHLPPGGRDAPAALSTLNDNLSTPIHLHSSRRSDIMDSIFSSEAYPYEKERIR